MKNYTENSLLEMIYDENLDIYSIVKEIQHFNKNFGFLKTLQESMSEAVNSIMSLEEYNKEIYSDERWYLAEKILKMDDALMEMWLATYEYRWEEFYEDWKINAFGCKIWIKISDIEIFKEFISTQTPQNQNILFDFLYLCILDSLNRKNFQHTWPEINENSLDIIWALADIENLSHTELKEFVTDYNDLSLFQSLLSKTYILKFYDIFYPQSISWIENFDELENVWADWLWAFAELLSSVSQDWKHWKYVLQLWVFLEEGLDYTYELIQTEVFNEKNRIWNWVSTSGWGVFKNSDHQRFVTDFHNLYKERKYFLIANMDLKKI